MALRICEECNGTVSSTAFECPHCGADYKDRPIAKVRIMDIAWGVAIGTGIAAVVTSIIIFIFSAMFKS
jgi:hypothetical protein